MHDINYCLRTTKSIKTCTCDCGAIAIFFVVSRLPVLVIVFLSCRAESWYTIHGCLHKCFLSYISDKITYKPENWNKPSITTGYNLHGLIYSVYNYIRCDLYIVIGQENTCVHATRLRDAKTYAVQKSSATRVSGNSSLKLC